MNFWDSWNNLIEMLENINNDIANFIRGLK